MRGHLARRRYRELRRKHPPKDERLRRKWAAERLEVGVLESCLGVIFCGECEWRS